MNVFQNNTECCVHTINVLFSWLLPCPIHSHLLACRNVDTGVGIQPSTPNHYFWKLKELMVNYKKHGITLLCTLTQMSKYSVGSWTIECVALTMDCC